MSDKTDRAVRLLRRLMRLQLSAEAIGNVHEAQAAAARIAEISDKYRLSVADLPEEELKASVKDEDWNEEGSGVKRSNRSSQWLIELAVAISRAHHCLSTSSTRSSRISFIGLEQDVVVSRAMMTILVRSALACYAGYPKKKKLSRSSYLRGFAHAIMAKYRDRDTQPANESQAIIRLDGLVKEHVADMPRRTTRTPKVDLAFGLGWRDGSRQSIEDNLLHGDEPKRLAVQNLTDN